MSTIVIEKYVDEICVEQLDLPVRPLQLLARLLPKQAWRQLERRGLDVEALLNDAVPHSGNQWLEVKEKDARKRVRILRRD
ncbi:hypothetical protein GGR25_000610 [Kaistia hirudinis]|uniref:Uncharacterized protein n=1 Tax=Kaistia hirudinis TaxID=1293440 RepID=A0A840AKZ3_9HYPH|nr:hypothetical protein [Kaistia hirudinis]MBB3929591.1 hypothetical protein [Kaistia hirudinis]